MSKGEYGGGYDKSDAAKDTGSSTGQVSHAWHDARDDAAKEGGWGVSKDRHGSSGGGGGGCFLATAVYGTAMAHEVQLFCRYRDEYLLKRSMGRVFVNLYYFFSPPAAKIIAKSRLACWIVRQALMPVIAMMKKRTGKG